MMHRLVFFMEPPKEKHTISLKAGMMCMNRFCIDEDASFEVSGFYDLKKPPKANKNDEAKGKVNDR